MPYQHLLFSTAGGIFPIAVETALRTAAVVCNVGSVVASVSATFEVPVYTATAAGAVGSSSAIVSATHVAPVFTATVACTSGSVTATAAATFTAAGEGVLFSESFNDVFLESPTRGWYDVDYVTLSESAYDGANCLQYSWSTGGTTPYDTSTIRHLFTEDDEIYIRFYMRLSTGWQWTGTDSHPHLVYFLTNENTAYSGLAVTHLTLYVEPHNGLLQIVASDLDNAGAPHGMAIGAGTAWASQNILFNDNQWHCVEAMFKLNTLNIPGDVPNADGQLRAWFDNQLVVEQTAIIFRTTDYPNMKINQVILAPYFGDGLLPQAQQLWIDELAVGTARVGPLNPILTATAACTVGSVVGSALAEAAVTAQSACTTGSVSAAANATFTAGAVAYLTDSFEGTPPSGWDSSWYEESTCETTNEIGGAPGGGSYAMRQWYGGTAGTLRQYFWLNPNIPDTIGPGESFYCSYYLYYNAAFNYGATTGFKTMIFFTDVADDYLYIVQNSSGVISAFFQGTQAWQQSFSSNTNGSNMVMPLGAWTKFEWYVYVSPHSQMQGILKGWVNDVLRWNYSGIATVESALADYNYFEISSTFNQQVSGANQKRYWDLFIFGPGSLAPS